MSLAEAGTLRDAATLSAQIDRMLADPKLDRFVNGFARQWLRTDSFLVFTPDPQIYRSYDDKLAEAIVREPLEFFRVVLENDLSTLNFLDADFLVVNERLAEHYDVPGVKGEEFRRVPLPADSPRGGLLAMAGVHQAGSDGIRTKPVSRAVYVREVLFNNQPDPPPPNAGEIEPNIKGEKLTVRDRLLQHQQIDACASCHRSLDPYGLALENFNVVGHWRDFQDGENFRGNNIPPIDPSGRLPNGSEFQTFDEFRQLLRQQDDRFRRALAERMLVFALGRPIEPTDDATLTSAAPPCPRTATRSVHSSSLWSRVRSSFRNEHSHFPTDRPPHVSARNRCLPRPALARSHDTNRSSRLISAHRAAHGDVLLRHGHEYA
jgi:hypothetical protein